MFVFIKTRRSINVNLKQKVDWTIKWYQFSKKSPFIVLLQKELQMLLWLLHLSQCAAEKQSIKCCSEIKNCKCSLRTHKTSAWRKETHRKTLVYSMGFIQSNYFLMIQIHDLRTPRGWTWSGGVWRLVKDLDQPEFWSYGHLKDPKIENEASKIIVLSSLRPLFLTSKLWGHVNFFHRFFVFP